MDDDRLRGARAVGCVPRATSRSFAEIASEFLGFIGDATIIAHNAPFDIGFLNFELEKAKLPSLTNQVIDTVEVARDRHPGARVSLDALCKHYGIDNSRRTLHGALLDSEILAEVYLELIGGRQVTLALTAEVHVETIEIAPHGAGDAAAGAAAVAADAEPAGRAQRAGRDAGAGCDLADVSGRVAARLEARTDSATRSSPRFLSSASDVGSRPRNAV